jgi:hypothetical protein
MLVCTAPQPLTSLFHNNSREQQITKLTNKTIVISETSTVSGFDVNKQTWYANAWHSIAVDFPRVAQVSAIEL